MNHLGGWLDIDQNTYMPEVWDDLLKKEINSVVDIGCGSGANLKWFHDKGLECLGIDGDIEAINKTEIKGLKAIKNDYTMQPAGIDSFDLALCTEFAEHIEQKYESNWFKDIQMCGRVLFTHALPGQGGYHHVNCQSIDYWRERFIQYGFTIDDEFTKKHRSNKYLWGRNTLTLFQKSNLK